MIKSLIGEQGIAAGVADDPDVIQKNARYRTILLAMGAVTCVLLLISSGLSLAGVIRLNQVSEDAQAQRQTLLECTTPGYACYQNGLDRQAEAVQAIIEEVDASGGRHADRVIRVLRHLLVRAVQEGG